MFQKFQKERDEKSNSLTVLISSVEMQRPHF